MGLLSDYRKKRLERRAWRAQKAGKQEKHADDLRAGQRLRDSR